MDQNLRPEDGDSESNKDGITLNRALSRERDEKGKSLQIHACFKDGKAKDEVSLKGCIHFPDSCVSCLWH